MNFLCGRTILLGVTGGIAACKVPFLVREIVERKGRVIPVLTENAKKFVTPEVLEVFSGERTRELFEHPSSPVHISLAKECDLVLVAPATFNFIGKIHAGIADDLLSCIIAATRSPVLFAPAMNKNMWRNPILQRNIKELEALGYKLIPPGEGPLACGEKGEGRMREVPELLLFVERELCPEKRLSGKKVLITGGGTEEEMDPVRVITNRSSGKMALSLAKAFFFAGAEVRLIMGRHEVELPSIFPVKNVRTVEEMKEAVLSEFEWCDILVMAAAVSDFIPERKKEKIKKGKEIILKLKPAPDILSLLQKKKKFIVGFSLESRNILKEGKRKLEEKKLDLVFSNPVKVLGGEETEGYIITGEKERKVSGTKEDVAWEIVLEIASMTT